MVQGCDASVLLDHTSSMGSEKETLPNQSLKGFYHIDTIKSELENVCPGVVSCADLLVVAAPESVVLVGGPFYPIHTGRKDSDRSYPEASTHLPSPLDNHVQNINTFAKSRNSHSSRFFEDRLYSFGGTDQPDPSMDPEFAQVLQPICNDTKTQPSLASASPSASPSASQTKTSSRTGQERAMKMNYEGAGSGFGTLYYRSLLQGKGILFVGQQLTAGEETSNWVRQYASDISLFHRDFAQVMMKLSSTQVLTGSNGEVRRNCRRVSSSLW